MWSGSRANLLVMRYLTYRFLLSSLVLAVGGAGCLTAQESLPLLEGEQPPQTFEALWGSYDPRAEPLDVEILKEWEEDEVLMKVVRLRIGIFKGRKAMLAAIYGYPKGAESLPGLVQIHGGGQYADHKAVLSNAKRGYATISIAWAGRISAPKYRVGPDQVKLFWEGDEAADGYRVTTDWGTLDGYHAPGRQADNAFPKIPMPADWTLDAVRSPRNNSWFLCTLAARRALTFLENQPQVDPDRLGVYGHSMGGKLTVMTAGSDSRVKAAAPSCGGVSDRYNDDPLFRATIGDDNYLRHITCPIVFLSPANDFHGRINDLQSALGEIQSKDWRVTCAPHHNHQDTAAYEVATQLWFDQQLKGTFTWPETPKTTIDLNVEDGIPSVEVEPGASKAIVSIDVFYTQDADPKADRLSVMNRFWHHAAATKQGGRWIAKLPISRSDQPLWAYANVTYALGQAVAGAGYYYGSYTAREFNLSSPMMMVSGADMAAAKGQVTLLPTLLIEAFEGDWEKEWFTYKAGEWPRRTHKINELLWAAPAGAKLSLQVRSIKTNPFLVGIDGYAAEVQLQGGGKWQTIVLSPADFLDARGAEMESWEGIRELRLSAQETLRERRPDATRQVGGVWNGEPPSFRDLRWFVDSVQQEK
ncbi:MAG: hypothetical protein ACI9UA_003377 [Pseudoalteromonas tetraodonis]|jgi:hypothetical protein